MFASLARLGGMFKSPSSARKRYYKLDDFECSVASRCAFKYRRLRSIYEGWRMKAASVQVSVMSTSAVAVLFDLTLLRETRLL